MRLAMEQAKADWEKLGSAQHCVVHLDAILQLNDDQLIQRFRGLFDETVHLLAQTYHERDLARQKIALTTSLHAIQTSGTWNILDSTSAFSVPVQCHIVAMVTEYLVNHLLALASEENPVNAQLATSTSSIPTEQQQELQRSKQMEGEAIYYVGGFIIRTLLEKSATPKSPLMNEVCQLLNGCIFNAAIEYLPAAARWTEELSRGRLVFISGYCFDLFLALERCANQSTKDCPDYREALDDEEVYNIVFHIGDSLNNEFCEEARMTFAEIIAKAFYELRGKALAKNRLEMAILSGEVLQDKHGIRPKLRRLENGCFETENL